MHVGICSILYYYGNRDHINYNNYNISNLNPRFRQIQFDGQGLPHEDVRVVAFQERLLQLLHLPDREVRSSPSPFLRIILVVIVVVIFVFHLAQKSGICRGTILISNNFSRCLSLLVSLSLFSCLPTSLSPSFYLSISPSLCYPPFLFHISFPPPPLSHSLHPPISVPVNSCLCIRLCFMLILCRIKYYNIFEEPSSEAVIGTCALNMV